MALGTFELQGATVRGGTIDMLDGLQFELLSGRGSNALADGVVVNGDVLLSSSLDVGGGATFNGDFEISGGSLNFIGDQNVGGGHFSFTGSTSGHINIRDGSLPTTLTLEPGVIVLGANGQIGNNPARPDLDTLVNRGLISADMPGEPIRISTDALVNEGTIEATGGGELWVGWSSAGPPVQWSNTGLIQADGGILSLAGEVSTPDMGLVRAVNGGELRLWSTVDNIGSTLSLGASTGSWYLNGTIIGGSVQARDNETLFLGGELRGVALDGEFVAANGDITQGLGLNGSIRVDPNRRIVFEGDQSISGGSIDLDGTVQGLAEVRVGDDSTLTIGSTSVVRGGGWVGSYGSNTRIINEGLLLSDIPGRELSVRPTVLENRGEMRVEAGRLSTGFQTDASNFGLIDINGGVFAIEGQFRQVGGTIDQSAGVLELGGTLFNQNSLLRLNGPSATFEHDGRIVGGTVEVLNGATFAVPANRSGVLDGVTFRGMTDLSTVGSILSVENGLTLDGSVRLSGADSLLEFEGTQTLVGGTIEFFGAQPKRLIGGVGHTLTLSPTSVIRGGGGSILDDTQVGGSGNTNELVNLGLISADVMGETLSVLPDVLTNQGTLEAVNGGVLQIGLPATQWSNSGALRIDQGDLRLGGVFTTPNLTGLTRTGGSLTLNGLLDNDGERLVVSPSTTGDWLLGGGEIRGGEIEVLGGANITPVDNGVGLFTDTRLIGDIRLTGVNPRLGIGAGFELDGSITSEVPAAIGFDFGMVLDRGTFIFEDGGALTSDNLTLDQGVVIRGGFVNLTRAGSGRADWINRGLVSADRAGNGVRINTVGTFLNEGHLEAINGGLLNIGGNGFDTEWLNTGSILVDQSTLELGGSFNISSLQGLSRNGGLIRLRGGVQNEGNDWVLDAGEWRFADRATVKGGSLTVPSSANVEIERGLVRFRDVDFSGNLMMNHDLGQLEVTGGLDLGGGTITMAGQDTAVWFRLGGSFSDGTIFFDGTAGGKREIGSLFSRTLTVEPTATIRGGEGDIYTGGTSTVLNEGLISADVSEQTIRIFTERFANLGTVQAINGGMIEFIDPPDGPSPRPLSVLLNSGVLELGSGSELRASDFVQTSEGLTTMTVGEAGAPRIDVFGTAYLGGVLEVELEVALGAGETIELFRWSHHEGEFDLLDLPALGGKLYWDTSTLYSNGSLSVVPASGSVAVLGLAGIVACYRRRRA